MGASQQSVEWKLNHEEKYLKEIKEENQKKNTSSFSSTVIKVSKFITFFTNF